MESQAAESKLQLMKKHATGATAVLALNSVKFLKKS